MQPIYLTLVKEMQMCQMVKKKKMVQQQFWHLLFSTLWSNLSDLASLSQCNVATVGREQKQTRPLFLLNRKTATVSITLSLLF